jgi:hypothetical protein
MQLGFGPIGFTSTSTSMTIGALLEGMMAGARESLPPDWALSEPNLLPDCGGAPPELLTVDVGAEPTPEVAPELEPVVPDGLVAPDVGVPAAALGPVVVVVPGVPDAEDVLDVDAVPESPAEVSAAATAVPRLRAAKPRKPAMAMEAVSFLMVLVVVISFPFGSLPPVSRGLGNEVMAPRHTPSSGERCVCVERLWGKLCSSVRLSNHSAGIRFLSPIFLLATKWRMYSFESAIRYPPQKKALPDSEPAGSASHNLTVGVA